MGLYGVAGRNQVRLTPPSGPNMEALGSCAKPAYLAPVKPANGLFPVPVAKLVGAPVGACPVAAAVDDVDGAFAGFCLWLLAAPFTRCMVCPSLILLLARVSGSLRTRPE